LKVSRSAYYTRDEQSTRARVDEQLSAKIVEVHAASNGICGAPRIHAELAEACMRHGRKRIARRMRAAGICGKSPRRWQVTTVADPKAARRPDLVKRDFTVDPAALDTRWCGAGSRRHLSLRLHQIPA
jgi:transposase InsO family protein